MHDQANIDYIIIQHTIAPLPPHHGSYTYVKLPECSPFIMCMVIFRDTQTS